MQLQRFALFNQRAHPIGLLPFFTGSQHKAFHFAAADVVDQTGFNRRAAGRQLVDDGNIEVGEKAHGQRTRNGGGGHHQLVYVAAFVFQGEALRHAEAVLLVHNHQAEVLEGYVVLKQGVRAHGQADAAVGQRGFRLVFFFLFEAT